MRPLYTYMSETDQILKGDGIKKGPRKDVSKRISQMKQFISEQRRVVELEFGSSKKTKPDEDILDFKPNIYGVGINLNAIWKKVTWWIRK